MNIFDWLKPGTSRAGTEAVVQEETVMETEVREQMEITNKEARLDRVKLRQKHWLEERRIREKARADLEIEIGDGVVESWEATDNIPEGWKQEIFDDVLPVEDIAKVNDLGECETSNQIFRLSYICQNIEVLFHWPKY